MKTWCSPQNWLFLQLSIPFNRRLSPDRLSEEVVVNLSKSIISSPGLVLIELIVSTILTEVFFHADG